MFEYVDINSFLNNKAPAAANRWMLIDKHINRKNKLSVAFVDVSGWPHKMSFSSQWTSPLRLWCSSDQPCYYLSFHQYCSLVSGRRAGNTSLWSVHHHCAHFRVNVLGDLQMKTHQTLTKFEPTSQSLLTNCTRSFIHGVSPMVGCKPDINSII